MRRGRDAGGAAGQVATALREEILGGRLPGGSPVREQDVAERLGVSRTPVREAVSRLVAEGLLIKDGNHTAHVFRPSLAELLEIYEIRMPLESLAARLACTGADEAFLDRLEAAGRALTEARSGVDWSVKHEAFHMCLVAGSRRPRLEALVRTLRVQSEPYVRLGLAFDADFGERARRDHEDIVRLVRARAADELEDLVRRHLEATSSRVSTLLEDHQMPPPPPAPGRAT
ncbi:GntR family transcriptional regulator [Pseudonocardia bannensis]|uniref:GntR family transcriptional regulator n=1 Tax=Pseudonocardia bannensis TaxID=630973 RepID=A0A848DEQ8_9PSEU|nr:GntR family transcriptional regulator [Pseudonocardia bannensis]NMH91055.1 GntR family transcriptional regulator [Pseudonocardia bannensis]